jgi:hypothetical protein
MTDRSSWPLEAFRQAHREAGTSTEGNWAARRSHAQLARAGLVNIEKINPLHFGTFVAIK